MTPLHAIAPLQLFALAMLRLHSYPVPPYAIFTATRYTTRSVVGKPPERGEARVRYAIRVADRMETYSTLPVVGPHLPAAIVGPMFQGPFAWSVQSAPAPKLPGSLPLPDVASGLKTIASVVAYARPNYAIGLVGLRTVAGHRTYHLHLRALRDPAKHDLRDLWIDAKTYDIWKARFRGEYAPAQWLTQSRSDVTVLFAPVGRYWVASQMLWTYFSLDEEAHYVYYSVTNRMVFPTSLPPWVFNQDAYDRRMRAGAPDVLGLYFAAPPTPTPRPPPPPTP